jgi:hypothetical protein
MTEQLRLDLNDRQQYLKQYIESHPCYSGESWHVFYLSGCNRLCLGKRHNSPVETEYSYKVKLTAEEAVWILQQDFKGETVEEWMDSIQRYRKANKNG